MKKTALKAFTLVEMLIVIVIIGILIAALLPRMQGAQGRARDVSRQTNLSQIATAIVSSQTDKGNWPQADSGKAGMAVKGIVAELLKSGMSDVPVDPNALNEVWGLGQYNSDSNTVTGDYIYMISTKNGSKNAGFLLMAKTETEGASNWVVCSGASDNGQIASGYDIANIHPCTKITESGDCKNPNSTGKTNECTYSQTSQLRYIYMY